jgi:hypothetical protein
MKTLRPLYVLFAMTAVAALSACGGGGSAAPATAATTTTTASAGAVTVSAATDAAKNGSYTPTVTKSTGYFGGITTDGKMDLAFVVNASNQVQRAMVWFHETPTVNRYFGCDSLADCANVKMTLATKEMAYSMQLLKEVASFPASDAAPLVLVTGGQTLVIDGTFTFK